MGSIVRRTVIGPGRPLKGKEKKVAMCIRCKARKVGVGDLCAACHSQKGGRRCRTF